jgi:integrase
VIPPHSEIIRLGFLDYAARIAPLPNDPLFPDLKPQGKDRKRGPRMTRWFVNYRRDVGVYREAVGMHAFRHTANTRLRDLITDYQQKRHVSYLFGHSQGGGEGRERYDKGPGLKAAAATLALLCLRIPSWISHISTRRRMRLAVCNMSPPLGGAGAPYVVSMVTQDTK